MRIGIVGDLHAPFIHPMYRRFCMDTFARYRVNHVHFIGDIVDLHALSFWEHNPNGHSAEDETVKALKDVSLWHRTFPGATVSIGNHDSRHFRTARKAGLPDRYLRDYAEVWRTPSWDWALEHRFDGNLYEHGTGEGGKDAAYNRMLKKRMSVIMGHLHSRGFVKWHTNNDNRKFGMQTGCGIDVPAYSFEYGKNDPDRPILGCGIVIDGDADAHFVPMPCGRNERYHRSRAGKKRRAA